MPGDGVDGAARRAGRGVGRGLTTPVGVSGAVFPLPVQVSVLGVPSPEVMPMNLLFNVVAGPGALLRFWRQHRLGGPLTRQVVAGTVPGVIIGAVIRVMAVPGPRVFRLLVAAVLLPLGVVVVVVRASGVSVAAPQPRAVAAVRDRAGRRGGGRWGGSMGWVAGRCSARFWWAAASLSPRWRRRRSRRRF